MYGHAAAVRTDHPESCRAIEQSGGQERLRRLCIAEDEFAVPGFGHVTLIAITWWLPTRTAAFPGLIREQALSVGAEPRQLSRFVLMQRWKQRPAAGRVPDAHFRVTNEFAGFGKPWGRAASEKQEQADIQRAGKGEHGVGGDAARILTLRLSRSDGVSSPGAETI